MNTLGRALITAGVVMLLLTSGVASAARVEVLWLGHATTRITSTTGKVIVIDPFLTKNPKTPSKYRDLTALGKVDLILVTHGHGDHVKDLGELAQLTGATVVGVFELINNLSRIGIIDASKGIGMNKGGTVAPLGRGIQIHMVPAEHSSSVDYNAIGLSGPETKRLRHVTGGEAVGYVVELENGFKIYHSGDTGVFGDMALINKLYSPDLALVCIGGHFTMGPEGAAYAVRELLRPKQVIPIHYGTYPVINRTPTEFKAALGDATVEVLDVKPGQAMEF
ncbi:MAG: metal-dependent hydrolase [Anaerolineales bacterium]